MIFSRIVYHFYWVHGEFSTVVPQDATPNRILDAPSNLPRKSPSVLNPRIDPWNMVDKGSLLNARRLAHIQRSKRTTPSSISAYVDTEEESLGKHIESAWKTEELKVKERDDIDWKQLCEAANLNRKSRVVVTGLFSVDPGPAVGFLLADRCDVEQLAGVDPIMPNLRKVRVAAMKMYRELYRSLEHFHLIIPTAAAGFSKRGERKELEWLSTFKPTHIIHMEGNPSKHFEEFIHSDAHLRLYQQQHSALSLDQLRSFVKANDHVKLLHVLVGSTTKSEVPSLMTRSRLELPHSYGPFTISKEYHHGALFVDSAVAAIVQAMGLSMTAKQLTRWVVTAPKEKRHSASDYIKAIAHPYQGDIAKNLTTYRNDYGVYANRLPCASSCAKDCTATVWDNVIPLTQKATEQCLYVIYTADFDANLRQVYKPPQKDQPLLCRLAFVAEQSPVAQHAIQHGEENGKVVIDNWTIVWVSKDDTTLTNAELSLLQLEPTRFFHKKVRKAMYAGSRIYAEPPDASILNILVRLDHQAMPRHFVKEYRHGTKLSRFIERPAERARVVGLFASEPSVSIKNMNEYQKLAEADPEIKLSRRQVTYYKHASHWIQMDMNRPDMEMRNTMFAPYPFQWVSMGLLVHDLQVEAARTLRCHWLDENTYWGSRGADEMSLAYVISERRIEGSLGMNVDEDWIPFWQKDEERLTEHNAEVFLRILKPHDDY